MQKERGKSKDWVDEIKVLTQQKSRLTDIVHSKRLETILTDTLSNRVQNTPLKSPFIQLHNTLRDYNMHSPVVTTTLSSTNVEGEGVYIVREREFRHSGQTNL